MSRFRQRLARGPLLMDGAMGTELLRLGRLRPGACGELLNLTAPEAVQEVHESYLKVGARCLLTHTFQANPLALARHGQQERLVEICQAALRLARQAAALDHFVVADVGPMHNGEDGEECVDMAALRQTVQALAEADGVLLETWSSPQALIAAAHVASWPETQQLPVVLSLTYRCHPDGRLETFSGHGPEWFARRAKDHGVAVLGVNCGRDMGLTEVSEVVRRYCQETDLPLLARPNAGTPAWVDGKWVYPVGQPETMDEMINGFRAIAAAGATLLGGCCGTTPALIAALRTVIST